METIKLSEFLETVENYVGEQECFIIGIAGGSSSGKSFIADKLAEKFKDALVLHMDDYIIPEKISANENWDLPDVWDMNLLRQNLVNLKQGAMAEKPVYDFMTQKIKTYEKIYPRKIVILEGIYSLHELIYKFIDLKIFVYSPERLRLSRRLERDIEERKQSKEQIMERWNESIQPVYLKYVEPQKKVADLVVVNDEPIKI